MVLIACVVYVTIVMINTGSIMRNYSKIKSFLRISISNQNIGPINTMSVGNNVEKVHQNYNTIKNLHKGLGIV